MSSRNPILLAIALAAAACAEPAGPAVPTAYHTLVRVNGTAIPTTIAGTSAACQVRFVSGQVRPDSAIFYLTGEIMQVCNSQTDAGSGDPTPPSSEGPWLVLVPPEGAVAMPGVQVAVASTPDVLALTILDGRLGIPAGTLLEFVRP